LVETPACHGALSLVDIPVKERFHWSKLLSRSALHWSKLLIAEHSFRLKFLSQSAPTGNSTDKEDILTVDF